jgi:hypothetical protein
MKPNPTSVNGLSWVWIFALNTLETMDERTSLAIPSWPLSISTPACPSREIETYLQLDRKPKYSAHEELVKMCCLHGEAL